VFVTRRHEPFIRRFANISPAELTKTYQQLASKALKTLEKEGVPKAHRSVTYQADIRYSGQGLTLTVDFDLKKLKSKGLSIIGDPFDEMHRQLFHIRARCGQGNRQCAGGCAR
jgi:N-methylhydantoinase A/oxoprolinase/acetone carboxylase beta subunit